jgi:CheY-like chemotaxis protein
MNLNQLNILLADDDSDDCLFFKKAIEELKLSTNLKIVHDGEQLMKYLSENPKNLPDILFLDLNMPRKNGFECLSEIKQNRNLKDLPLVILSTSNSKDMIGMVFKIGAQVFIHKPGDFAQLKQVIYHALPIATEKKFSNSPVKYILNA